MSVELFCAGFTSTCVYFFLYEPTDPQNSCNVEALVLRVTRRPPFSGLVVRAPFVLEGHGKTS